MSELTTPKQKRSRRSAERALDASLELLEEQRLRRLHGGRGQQARRDLRRRDLRAVRKQGEPAPCGSRAGDGGHCTRARGARGGERPSAATPAGVGRRGGGHGRGSLQPKPRPASGVHAPRRRRRRHLAAGLGEQPRACTSIQGDRARAPRRGRASRPGHGRGRCLPDGVLHLRAPGHVRPRVRERAHRSPGTSWSRRSRRRAWRTCSGRPVPTCADGLAPPADPSRRRAVLTDGATTAMIPNPNLDSELERDSQMRLGTTTFSFTNEWLARFRLARADAWARRARGTRAGRRARRLSGLA